MSSKKRKQQNHQESRREKREQFAKEKAEGGSLKLVLIALALVVVAGYLILPRLTGGEAGQTQATTLQRAAGAAEIRIPLKEVGDGHARFYEQAVSGGRTARFFVVRTSDGVYRAALDACQVCFREKKGYYQDCDQMVCRNCGRHFNVSDVNDGTTGCHPIGLTRKVEGDQLVIKESELEAGGSYF